MQRTIEVGAYFYPLTRACAARREHATLTSLKLGLPLQKIPDELELAKQAQPLFEGHDQPRTYCLGPNMQRTNWDDTEIYALAYQMGLAAVHGISYFIFDTYNGLRNNEPVRQLTEANRMAAEVAILTSMFGFKYARMEVLEGPRSILPIPNGRDLPRNKSARAFCEPGRSYDVTPECARFIVDCNINEWANNPAYLRIDGYRPYLSIMMPAFPEKTSDLMRQHRLINFINAMRRRAAEYSIRPYLVGNTRQSSDAEIWAATDVDAITQYCALHTHEIGHTPIQDYRALAKMREQEWHTLQDTIVSKTNNNTAFLPSVAVGWDASPRGEQGYTLDQVSGLHPYTPMVANGSPSSFGQHLHNAIDFTAKTVKPSEQLVTIFAWNEVGEGGALLPRLRPDGTVDKSYLNATSEVIHKYARCSFCAARRPNGILPITGVIHR